MSNTGDVFDPDKEDYSDFLLRQQTAVNLAKSAAVGAAQAPYVEQAGEDLAKRLARSADRGGIPDVVRSQIPLTTLAAGTAKQELPKSPAPANKGYTNLPPEADPRATSAAAEFINKESTDRDKIRQYQNLVAQGGDPGTIADTVLKPGGVSSSSVSAAGFSSGGAAPFKSNDPNFQDLPFPLVEPEEYRALLLNRGTDPAAVDAEVARYESWRQTAPGLGDQIESDKVRSQQNAYGIEGERLGGLRAIGQQKIGAYEQMLPALQDVEAQRKKAWDDADRQYQDHLKAYDAEITDLHNTTINPTRIFDTNESNRALAAIAVGLGEFANQFTGHGNAALKIVSDAIDRDIEAQKAGVNTKYMALGVRSNLLNRLHDRFGDVNMAAQAAKAGMYEQLAMYTEYLGAQIGDKNVVAQAKKNAEELRALSTQAKLAFDLAAQQRADQQKAQANAWAYSASQGIDEQRKSFMDLITPKVSGGSEQGQWVPMDKDLQQTLVRGSYLDADGNVVQIEGFAPTDDERKQYTNMIFSADTIEKNLRKIEKLNAPGSTWFGTDAGQKEAAGLISATMNEYIALLQRGASKQLTESEKEGLAPAFMALNNRDIGTSLNNIRGRMDGIRSVLGTLMGGVRGNIRETQTSWIKDASTGQMYQGAWIPGSLIKDVNSGYKPKEKPGKKGEAPEDLKKPAKGVVPFEGDSPGRTIPLPKSFKAGDRE